MQNEQKCHTEINAQVLKEIIRRIEFEAKSERNKGDCYIHENINGKAFRQVLNYQSLHIKDKFIPRINFYSCYLLENLMPMFIETL